MEEAVKQPIALVTPTRDRAEAMAMVARWMARQLYDGIVHWIIVDDGDVPVDMQSLGQVMAARENWRINYVRRDPSGKPCTLQENLLAALDAIAEEPVAAMLIIEDDEYYTPLYVEEMVWRLEKHDIVGEMKARYYNVRERRWDLMTDNTRHASLCRTGMVSKVFPAFRKIVEHHQLIGNPFIDMALWGSTALIKPPPPPPLPPEMIGRPWAAGAEYKAPLSGAPSTSLRAVEAPPMPDYLSSEITANLFEGRGISVGIKGMPGRNGIGRAHAARVFKMIDPDWAKLVEWLGYDSKFYIEFAKEKGWGIAT